MEVLSLNTFLFRLFLALLLGACVGIERELKQRNAGLVTNALVSVGAATYILISVHVSGSSGGDPSRVLAQVVTGIGFLGAGVIVRDGFSVFGLNTAATIWCSAAVGCLCGFGYCKEALIASAVTIIAHFVFRPLIGLIEKHPIKNKLHKETGYKIVLIAAAQNESEVRSLLLQQVSVHAGLQLRLLTTHTNEALKQFTLTGEIVSYGRMEKEIKVLVTRLATHPAVQNLRWEVLKHPLE